MITSYLIIKFYIQRLKILGLIHNLILNGPFFCMLFSLSFHSISVSSPIPYLIFPLITLRTYLINAALCLLHFLSTSMSQLASDSSLLLASLPYARMVKNIPKT